MVIKTVVQARWLGVLAFSLTLWATPSFVLAQKGQAGRDKEGARALAEKGIDLLEAKRYGEAISRFEQAEERFHAPTHFYLMARAYAEMGKLVLAKKHYKKVTDEVLANYAPEAFLEAQQDAKKELAELEPRIPKLKISVSGADAGSVNVLVDNEKADWRAGPVDVDPGEHTVQASSPKGDKSERVQVKEGDALDMALVWESAAAQENKPEASSSQGGAWPAYVAFGVGGAGLVLGSVMGGLAISKMNELEEKCPTKQCDPANKPIADSARTFAHVSTAGFVLGGAGLAAGALLLVLSPGKPAPAEAYMRPWIGLGQAGVVGRF